MLPTGRCQTDVQRLLSIFTIWRQRLTYDTKNITYYEILGISKDATQSEIKKAYYQRSKELHPDRKGCTNNEVKRRSDAFIQLTEAYEILKVPERRRSYDISLDENGTFANCTKRPDVDGLFTGFQHASKESPSSIAEMYYGFWQNFGVFGDCLRFIAQSMIVAVVAVGALIRFSK